jgi:hypothetical protein
LFRNKSINFRHALRHFNKFLQKNTNVLFNQFKTFNLNFFHLNALDSYELNNIIFAHKKTIYREVFIFIERVNDYAHVIDEIVV